jgi:hypothetical protein
VVPAGCTSTPKVEALICATVQVVFQSDELSPHVTVLSVVLPRFICAP